MLGFQLLLYKIFLCAHFGEYKLGAELASELGDKNLKEGLGVPGNIVDPFARGICLYAMARQTGERNFIRHANKARSTIRDWAKKGNPNVVHMLKLLDAEKAALNKGDKELAKKQYNEAVTLAVRGGFVQDAALAHERHADFLFGLLDYEGALYYMKQATKYYSRWGADQKVQMLNAKCAELSQLNNSRLSISWSRGV